MELFDAIIRRTREYLSAYSPRRYPYDAKKCWKETASGEMILLRDAAYELGGGNCESVNYTCATSDQELLMENEILLFGEDLPELKQDTSFARIVFLRTDAADNFEGEDELYRFVRELEYVRYHIFPKGYMVRTSAKSSREQARVSKDAIGAGINFERLGSAYQEISEESQGKECAGSVPDGDEGTRALSKRGAANGCGHGGAEPYFAGNADELQDLRSEDNLR